MQANLSPATIGFSEPSTAAIVSDISVESSPEDVGVDFSELIEEEQQETEQVTETDAEVETGQTTDQDETDNDGMLEEQAETTPAKKLTLHNLPQEGLEELLASSKTLKTGTLNDAMRQNMTVLNNQDHGLEASIQNSGLKRDNLGSPVSEDAFPDGWEVLLDDTDQGEKSKDASKAVKATLQQSGLIKLAEASPKTEMTEELELPLELDDDVVKKDPESPAHAIVEKGKLIKPVGVQMNETIAKPDLAQLVNAAAKGSAVKSEVAEVAALQATEVIASQELNGDVNAIKVSETVASSVTAKGAVQTPAQLLARMDEVQKQMVVKDFVQATKQGIHGKENQLIVELHPPELGRIRVKLDAQGDQINAQLTMQDRHVGEFFQERLESIRKSLEAAGIRLNDLSLEIKQQFAQETLQEQQDKQNRNGFNDDEATKGLSNAKHTGAAKSVIKLGKVDMII